MKLARENVLSLFALSLKRVDLRVLNGEIAFMFVQREGYFEGRE